MFENLQMPWWKSKVTSPIKELANLAQSMRVRCTVLLKAAGSGGAVFSRTHYSIFVRQMSVKRVQFMSQLLTLIVIQKFTHVKEISRNRLN